MFIYVVSFKKLLVKGIFLLLVISVGVFAVLSWGAESIGVFSNTTRKLPIYSVETGEKKVSITFDCAWGADDIPQILELLRQAEAKATFFIVGQWAEKYPDAVKQIAARGHDIANHGYSHLRMGALSADKARYEIEQCNKALEKICGKKVELFRAPYGDYTNNTVEIAQEAGCFTIQWDVDSLDWRPEISGEEIIKRVLRKVQPGSIILFHNDTAHTVKILPVILASLKNEGYEFVPVSELIFRENFEISPDGRQKLKNRT
jgi:polysaccharide deacetylase family sporulation protein PdaB